MAEIPNSQIHEINKLLLAYSSGAYRTKGRISRRKDAIDSIILGVNMLGEELFSTTVSRDFFSSIYNAVTNSVFVVGLNGKIKNCNCAAEKMFGYKQTILYNHPISLLLANRRQKFLSHIKKALKEAPFFNIEALFISSGKKVMSVLCACSKIFDRNHKFSGYLLIVEDITERKDTEHRILRAIVDAQEKERKRVSKDLHDSLGGEQSFLAMNLKSLRECHLSQNKQIEIIDNSLKTLKNSEKVWREICFNLMPASLEKGNIIYAVEELVKKLKGRNLPKIHVRYGKTIHTLNKPIEIAIYRIVQEFINNTLKHAHAKNMYIHLYKKRKICEILLSDDGCGFDFSEKIKEGRGLSNIISRIKAFRGTYSYVSKINEGSFLKITLPII